MPQFNAGGLQRQPAEALVFFIISGGRFDNVEEIEPEPVLAEFVVLLENRHDPEDVNGYIEREGAE